MNKIGMTAVSSLAPQIADAQRGGQAEAAAEDQHALEDIVAARARAKARRTGLRARFMAFIRRR